MKNYLSKCLIIAGTSLVYLALAPSPTERPRNIQSISPLESGVLLETKKGIAPNSPGIPPMEERPEYQQSTQSFMPTQERFREIKTRKY